MNVSVMLSWLRSGSLVVLVASILFPAARVYAQQWLYEEQSEALVPPDSSAPGSGSSQSRDSLSKAEWNAHQIPVRSDSILLNTADTLQAPAPSRPDTSAIQKPQAADAAMPDTSRKTSVGGSKGEVRGLVLSAEDGKPLDKAAVVLRMDSLLLRATSDAEGMFVIRDVIPGTWQLRVSRKGYASGGRDRLLVRAGDKLLEEYPLERRIAKGAVMEVAKPRATGGADFANKRQQTAAVMEGVTAEQIAKSTDSDAGAIARRVTGTSLVGGKYVYVRGLGERYTNMTLNGLPVPTPEKDKRVVPQDLFPASALESFAIYKTWTPDLPPDFAGGSVALETKGFPEKDFIKVSLGLGATDYLGDGGFLDIGSQRLDMQTTDPVSSYFGFKTSGMDRPKGMPDVVSSYIQPDASERAELAGLWDNRWSLDTSKVYPDQSFAINVGKTWKPERGGQAGYLASVNFKNHYYEEDRERIKVQTTGITDSVLVERRGKQYWLKQLVYDTVNGTPQPVLYLLPGLIQNWKVGGYETSTSVLLDAGWETRDNHWWTKNLYAALSERTARYYTSYSVPGVSTGQSNPLEERFLTDFSRRSIAVSQFGAGHYIGKSILDSMSWAMGVAHSGGENPDAKKWYYVREDSTTIRWETKAPWGTRQFQDFGETGLSARADFWLVVPEEWSKRTVFLERPGMVSRWKLPTARTGVQGEWKSREFDMNTYLWDALPLRSDTTGNYAIVDSLMNPDSVAAMVARGDSRFQSFLGDYDTYTAHEAKGAAWIAVDQEFNLWNKPVQVSLGGRSEWYWLDFVAPFTSEAAVGEPSLRMDSAEVIERLDWNLYPSTTVAVEFLPRTKLRLSWSQTLVRPEFRERLPTTFWDPDEGIEVIGNPNLLDTRIQHWDIRLEKYLPEQQILAASLFRKDFKDPVEAVINAIVDPEQKEFQNAKSAWVQGIEVEADLSLSPMIRGKRFDSRILRGFSFYGNAAWMQSQVQLDTTRSGVELLTSKKRPLVGQSPWLYNVKIAHEVETAPKSSLMNALLYNVSGRRIRALGTEDVPDMYEEAFHALDWMTRYKMGDIQWTLKIKNLLNATQRYTVTEFHQNLHYETISDADRDELFAKNNVSDVITVSRRKPGLGYSIGMDWQW